MIKIADEEIDRVLESKNLKRLEQYKHFQYKMLVLCIKCEKQWRATFGNLRRKHTGCPRCLGLEKLNNEKIDEKIKERFIQRIGNYRGLTIPITWKCISPQCPISRFEWNQTPARILHKNRGCPACGVNKGNIHNLKNKLTNECIDRKLKENCRSDISRISDYVGNRTHVVWKCSTCQHQWSTTTGHILYGGTGCPLCKKKSEHRVKLLIEKYITNLTEFKPQKNIFNILPNKRSIVDFYFKIYNAEFIIEYNGEQHYMPIDRGQGKTRALKSFEYQKVKDESKRKYCKDNNIFLLEIPYWFTENETILQLQMINSGNYEDIPITIIPDILPRQSRSIWQECNKIKKERPSRV